MNAKQESQSQLVARNLDAWRKAKALREYQERARAIRRGASLQNMAEALKLARALL